MLDVRTALCRLLSVVYISDQLALLGPYIFDTMPFVFGCMQKTYHMLPVLYFSQKYMKLYMSNWLQNCHLLVISLRFTRVLNSQGTQVSGGYPGSGYWNGFYYAVPTSWTALTLLLRNPDLSLCDFGLMLIAEDCVVLLTVPVSRRCAFLAVFC